MRNAVVGCLLFAAFVASPALAQQSPDGPLENETPLCTTVRHAALVEAATNGVAFRFRDYFERLCLPTSAPRPLRDTLTIDHCSQAEKMAPAAEINNGPDLSYWKQERARCRTIAGPQCPDFIRFDRDASDKAVRVLDAVRGDSALAFDDHGHLLGVYLDRLPQACQATVNYAAAAAAEWLVDYPADRAARSAGADEIIRELNRLLTAFAAEDAAARLNPNAREMAVKSRYDELMTALRALLPRPQSAQPPSIDQRRRDALTSALRLIGFETGEIDEGIRQFERDATAEPKR